MKFDDGAKWQSIKQQCFPSMFLQKLVHFHAWFTTLHQNGSFCKARDGCFARRKIETNKILSSTPQEPLKVYFVSGWNYQWQTHPGVEYDDPFHILRLSFKWGMILFKHPMSEISGTIINKSGSWGEWGVERNTTAECYYFVFFRASKALLEDKGVSKDMEEKKVTRQRWDFTFSQALTHILHLFPTPFTKEMPPSRRRLKGESNYLWHFSPDLPTPSGRHHWEDAKIKLPAEKKKYHCVRSGKWTWKVVFLHVNLKLSNVKMAFVN